MLLGEVLSGLSLSEERTTIASKCVFLSTKYSRKNVLLLKADVCSCLVGAQVYGDSVGLCEVEKCVSGVQVFGKPNADEENT